jgi:hypothetical protein
MKRRNVENLGLNFGFVQIWVWRAALCANFDKIALGAPHVGGNFEIYL